MNDSEKEDGVSFKQFFCVGLLKRDARGVAALEFALALPILLLLVLGGVELARYILIDQKVALVADSATDILSQTDQSDAEIKKVVSSLPRFMEPYGFSGADKVTFSIVEPSGDSYTIRKIYGDETRLVVGQGPLTDIGKDNTVVVGELFYNFSPILAHYTPANQFLNRSIYKVALFKPRAGTAFNDVCSTCSTGGPCPSECEDACLVPGDPECVADPCTDCPGPSCPAICEDPCAACAADPAGCPDPSCVPPVCSVPGVCDLPGSDDYVPDPCTTDPADCIDPGGDVGPDCTIPGACSDVIDDSGGCLNDCGGGSSDRDCDNGVGQC